MTLSCTQLQFEQAFPQLVDHGVVCFVVDLTIQVLDPIDQNPQHFLNVRAGMASTVTWVTRTLTLDELEQKRRLMLVPVIEEGKFVHVPWI